MTARGITSNYIVPSVTSLTPSPGVIDVNATAFDVNFSTNMNVNSLNSGLTLGNVTFTNATMGEFIPVTCSSVNCISMNCTIPSNSLTYGDGYNLNLNQGYRIQFA